MFSHNTDEEWANGFLRSDTEIYNVLLDAKKTGHPLLKHFKILYPNKVPVEPINAVYVGRMGTTDNRQHLTNDSSEWCVVTDIYIVTKKYDHLERYRLLKTMTYAVMEILSRSRIADFIDFPEQNFVYDSNNILQTSKIRVISYETSHKTNWVAEEVKNVCEMLTEMEIVDK